MAESQTLPTPAAQPAPAPAPAPEKTSPQPPEMGLASLLDVIVDEQTKGLLVAQEVERRQFSNNLNLATALANSGYFSDAADKWKALAKIEIGRSWGLSAADSMKHIYLVNGKPALENEIIAARLRMKGWDWEPWFVGGAGVNCVGVHLWILKDGKPFMRTRRNADGSPVNGDPVVEQVCVSFLEADAKAAKLWDKKGPWSEGYRANMLYWRAVAQFRRFYANDVLTGALMPDEAREIGAQPEPSAALAGIRNEIDNMPEWVIKKPTAKTLLAIRGMKATIGETLWSAALSGADPSEIKTDEEAQKILAAMQSLATTEAA